jgi:very-short-patch-repair endonuclease
MFAVSYVFNPKESEKYRRRLRNESTTPERVLWSKLRGRQVEGYKFRRQFGIGIFVVDFYCSELKLAIEVDGDPHAGEREEEYDRYREKCPLSGFGLVFPANFTTEYPDRASRDSGFARKESCR